VLAGLWARRVRQYAAIRDRHVTGRDDGGHQERRLHVRLVEARKRAPRIGRLELRGRVLAPVRLAHVQTAERALQLRGVLDPDPCRAGCQAPPHGQGRRLTAFVGRDRRRLAAPARHDRRLLEGDADRVEGDLRGRFHDIDEDLLGAGDGVVLEVQREVELVLIGDDVGRERLGRDGDRACEEKDGCQREAPLHASCHADGAYQLSQQHATQE
jgi:hypothetical protein